MKAATIVSRNSSNIALFQSTPPVKAATLSFSGSITGIFISIHAAREGGDQFAARNLIICGIISIHAAREGGDALNFAGFNSVFYFNPRRP